MIKIWLFLTLSLLAFSSVLSAQTQVPDINELTFNDARELLVNSGWRPKPFRGVSPPLMQVLTFKRLGFEEIESCSGTEVNCTFKYTNTDGDLLTVISKGEQTTIGQQKFLAKVKEYTLHDYDGNVKNKPIKNAPVALKLPNIDGLTYHEARKVLIKEGWDPVPYDEEIAGYGQEKYFKDLGYNEIQSCGGGAPFCLFSFKNTDGDILKVVSAGEEDTQSTPPYFAMVNNYRIEDTEQEAKKAIAAALAEKTKEAQRTTLWSDIINQSAIDRNALCEKEAMTHVQIADMRDAGYRFQDVLAGIGRNHAKGKSSESRTALITEHVIDVYGKYADMNSIQIKALAYQFCTVKNAEAFNKKSEDEYRQKLISLGMV